MSLVTFVIPVRHQDNATDWSALKRRLSQTIASIAAQTNRDWQAVIIANDGADLPELPPQFSVVRVDFPPNQFYDIDAADKEKVYEAVRLDKGRRILSGMLSARDSGYFMIVDDDDFISARIVAHVAAHRGQDGWKVQRGYLWSEGGRYLLHHDDFANFCGTSLIIRSDLYGLPHSQETADPDYVKAMLGSHIKIGTILAERGHPLKPLPFRGAIYRVGHSGAHSRSIGLLKAHFLNKWALRNPHHLLRNLAKLRIIGTGLKREFFGEKAPGSAEQMIAASPSPAGAAD